MNELIALSSGIILLLCFYIMYVEKMIHKDKKKFTKRINYLKKELTND